MHTGISVCYSTKAVTKRQKDPLGPSLRLRLAFWCGGLICGAVILAAAYGYSVYSRAHYDELDATLRKVTEHVVDELATAPTTQAQLQVLAASRMLDVGIRIYDKTGRVQEPVPVHSIGPAIDPRTVLQAPLPFVYGSIVAFMPAVNHVSTGRGVFGMAHMKGGARWRVYVLPVNASMPYIVASMPLAEFDTAVHRFAWLMAVMALLASAATFITGWLLAGRVFRPVTVLSETARSIARSGQLSDRVRVGESHVELGRLADAFNEMLERLEHAHVVQRRFISDASHEFRAPLTVVQGNLELLLRHTMTETDRRDAIREAHIEATRLGRLVADLLSLARADADMPVRSVPVELDRVLLEVLGEARHLGSHHRIEVAVLEPVTIYGDQDQLKQLLLILVDNAVKYTPAGGRVTASLQCIADRADRSGDLAEVTIHDTGIGISPSELSHVFDRFYRGDPARVRDPGGTGLGLPIARWVATQHGGTVTLSSEPGCGTVATLRLPIPRPA